LNINNVHYTFLRSNKKDDTLFILGRSSFHEREIKIVRLYIWSKILQIWQTIQPTWTVSCALDCTE